MNQLKSVPSANKICNYICLVKQVVETILGANVKNAVEKFRGWLCHDCNRGIGNLGEDIARLQRSIEYLSDAKKHQETSKLTEFFISDPVSC